MLIVHHAHTINYHKDSLISVIIGLNKMNERIRIIDDSGIFELELNGNTVISMKRIEEEERNEV